MLNQDNDRSYIYKISLDVERVNDVRIMAYDYIDENSTVLDVGCACGDFGELINRDKGCIVHGMEYDAGSIDIAMHTNAYEAVHQVDLNTFDESKYTQYHQNFDTIVLLDVLEHILNPEEVLHSLKKYLKEDGFFIISLPNVAFCDIKIGLLQDEFTYTDTGILDKTHLKFYTYKSISSMVTRMGLEIYACQPKVDYFSIQTGNVPRSVIRYIKKDPHSFVYQYLIKVSPTLEDVKVLRQLNDTKMVIKWPMISQIIKKLKRRRQIATLFPKDTVQYKIAKKLKSFLKKDTRGPS